MKRNYDDTPTYNIKAVVKETGIHADTLRAWERRYGLPKPERTAGGHRIFSQHDVETLKWLAARREEGLTISRAVELWRSLVEEGQDPLSTQPYALPTKKPLEAEGAALDSFRESWIQACKAFDEDSAEQILTRAFALYPAETVCFEILTRGLHAIGEGWYEGDATVQQEHFASELAIRRVETLLAASSPPSLPRRILVMCPPHEDHTYSPLLITWLLRRQGLDALFLGANVPLQRLEEALDTTGPDLVILSAQGIHTAANLAETAAFLQERGIPCAYGGRIFNRIPELQNRIHGHYMGQRLQEVPGFVERYLQAPFAAPKIERPSDQSQRALQALTRHRADVESRVGASLREGEIPNRFITIANLNLTRDLTAALHLGDIAFVGEDLEWIRGLLRSHALPLEMLHRYLTVYAQALRETLGDPGVLIADYLSEQLAEML